ncbi:MAG: HAMP domain-containing histidine kinase [Gemmatimonadaceae bacterium]|nr:HAMP domain-containing histidine kinase [Gemmatimonadaceae bacterium]
MKHSRFRTRLFLILALFAIVPAMLITAGWTLAAWVSLPLMSGAGAWEQVAESGDRAVRLAREQPGSPAADSALLAHREVLGQSREQAMRFRFLAERRAPAAILAVGVFVLVVLTLLASRVAGHLSRQLSRPLDELVGWTGRIANQERLPLPQEGEAKGAPEFGVLRDGMRRMAGELEKGRQAALEAERLAAFRESARQVAHELKNPLTPIRFAIAALRRSAAPEQRDAVEVLDVESARLEAMAKSFAQFGRLPEGPTAAVDLAELARETARTTLPAAMTVRVEGEPGALVLGQHDALQRALANVLLNAADATGGAGTVEVRAQVQGGEAVLAVRDDGVGIPAEQLERIWEPYVTQKTGGTGLGLAIVKQTVVAHGGRVEAVSEPGRGTEVRLRFPRVDGRTDQERN